MIFSQGYYRLRWNTYDPKGNQLGCLHVETRLTV